MEDDAFPSDAELRKRLFSSPTPDETSVREGEDDGERVEGKGRGKDSKSRRKRRKSGFNRLSLLAVMLFLVLCASALAVTLHFDNHWRHITWAEVQEGGIILHA